MSEKAQAAKVPESPKKHLPYIHYQPQIPDALLTKCTHDLVNAGNIPQGKAWSDMNLQRNCNFWFHSSYTAVTLKNDHNGTGSVTTRNWKMVTPELEPLPLGTEKWSHQNWNRYH